MFSGSRIRRATVCRVAFEMRPHSLRMGSVRPLPRSFCVRTFSGLNDALSAFRLRSCILTDSANSFQRGFWLSILVLQLGPTKTLGPWYPSHLPNPLRCCHPLLVPSPNCYHALRPDMYMFSGRNSSSFFWIESKSASVYFVSDWRGKTTVGGMPEVLRKRRYCGVWTSQGMGTRAQTMLACTLSATQVASLMSCVRRVWIGRFQAPFERSCAILTSLFFRSFKACSHTRSFSAS